MGFQEALEQANERASRFDDGKMIATRELRGALKLIKCEMTGLSKDWKHDRNLHEAVQKIVTACRRVGLLEEHGAR